MLNFVVSLVLVVDAIVVVAGDRFIMRPLPHVSDIETFFLTYTKL